VLEFWGGRQQHVEPAQHQLGIHVGGEVGRGFLLEAAA
jgi:hypothetical protein